MLDRESTRVGLIGAGRLGASLAAALREAGYCVAAVASAHPTSAARLAAAVRAEATTPQAAAEACDLVFLTVPDAAIGEVVANIQWRVGQAVVHCSGALDLAVLAPSAGVGARPGCLHPLQAFPSRDGDAGRFRDITCGIEADGGLGAALEHIAFAVGAGRIVRLEGVDRAAYHAAAVFASNYVVSLMGAAAEIWTAAGLPPEAARPALAPLLGGTAQNVADRALAQALTGPIARGDVATIERHLAALREPRLRELYRALGAELLALDLGHPPEVAARLREALGDTAQGSGGDA